MKKSAHVSEAIFKLVPCWLSKYNTFYLECILGVTYLILGRICQSKEVTITLLILLRCVHITVK